MSTRNCRHQAGLKEGSEIKVTFSKEKTITASKIGEGSYNNVFYFTHPETNQCWVIKYQTSAHADEALMDTPSRLKRTLKEVHPEIPTNIIDKGFAMPYIDFIQATDQETAQAVVDIYRRTQRIVVDAYVNGNFVKDKTNKRVSCIDTGLALRRGSIISDNFWTKEVKYFHKDLNSKDITNQKPITTSIIKILLKIQEQELPKEKYSNHWITYQNILALSPYLKSNKSFTKKLNELRLTRVRSECKQETPSKGSAKFKFVDAQFFQPSPTSKNDLNKKLRDEVDAMVNPNFFPLSSLNLISS